MLYLLILLSIGINHSAGGQPAVFDNIYTGAATSDRFYTDQLNNIYFIDNHKFIKIETYSDEVLEYGSLSYGAITSADVSNPLQILLFYRDFNQIAFLNNKLGILHSPLNLSTLGIEQAQLVCSSGKGGIWVFNERDNRLVYFDQQFRSSNRSKIIAMPASGVNPVYMIEEQNNLYMYVPDIGILVYDRFASHVATIPYSGPERFQVIGGRIIYFYNKELIAIDTKTREKTILNLPPDIKVDDAQLQPDRIYVLSGEEIKLFRTR